jgi:hypothetical protein
MMPSAVKVGPDREERGMRTGVKIRRLAREDMVASEKTRFK